MAEVATNRIKALSSQLAPPSMSSSEPISFTTFYNIIDGARRSGKTAHQGVNPATGRKLWEVPIAEQNDLDDAVAAARRVFPSWSQTPIEQRKELMKQFVGLFNKTYTKDMIELFTQETGKPPRAAKGEVAGAINGFLLAPTKYDLPVEVEEDKEKVLKTFYKPVGVCAGICPWNFPLGLACGKIGPALIAGCPIIIKPSPYTPYTSLKLIEIMQLVFPPGVVQAVGGSDALGPMITAHPGIAKISFTGSIATGKKIMAACANTLKRVTLELGGNDPCIVMPDVDIAKVAPIVAQGFLQNSGQVCVAIKRIFIHQSIYEPFRDALVKATRELKFGAPSEPGVTHGPIQNAMQYEKVKGYLAESKDQGHIFAYGSGEVKERPGGGYFIEPQIVDNPPLTSRLVTEEPFGPIVPIMPWETIPQVLTLANDTNAGLGACIFSADVEKAQELAQHIDAGGVWINSMQKPIPNAFFSGHKESGIGGEWGARGLLQYCNAVCVHTYKS